MTTATEQKEIQKLIRQYSRLKNEDLKKMLDEIENTSSTFGDKKRKKLQSAAIRTLLM
jgi:transposase-like protein